MSSEDEPNQERTSRDERAGGRELKQLRDELDRAKIREDKLENKLTSLQTRLDEKESGDADPLNSSSKSGKQEQETSLFSENSELPTDEFSANFGLPTGENFGPGKLYANLLESLVDQSIPLETFHGFGDVSVQEWVSSIVDISKLKQWSSSQTLRRALLLLRGPAATAARIFRDEIHSLEQLSKFLHRRFGIKNPKDHYTRVLSRIRQGSDTGRKFIDRFQDGKTKVSLALPEYFSDSHFVTFFKQALNPDYRNELRRCKPRNLEACFDAVRDADIFLEGKMDRE